MTEPTTTELAPGAARKYPDAAQKVVTAIFAAASLCSRLIYRAQHVCSSLEDFSSRRNGKREREKKGRKIKHNLFCIRIMAERGHR